MLTHTMIDRKYSVYGHAVFNAVVEDYPHIANAVLRIKSRHYPGITRRDALMTANRCFGYWMIAELMILESWLSGITEGELEILTGPDYDARQPIIDNCPRGIVMSRPLAFALCDLDEDHVNPEEPE